MLDASQLWLKESKHEPKRRRLFLAAAGQVTYREKGGNTEDFDVMLAPAVMKQYTAATCAGILGDPTDSTGLLPRGEAAPNAKYIASLIAVDSHSVNKLTSKWLASEQAALGNNRLHAPSWCTQHKTGNAGGTSQ